MTYTARTIHDRVAEGDDCYILEKLPDGRVRLIPDPDSVTAPGTDLNRALFQPFEDFYTLMKNSLGEDFPDSPSLILFDTLEAVTTTGIWLEEAQRIEC